MATIKTNQLVSVIFLKMKITVSNTVLPCGTLSAKTCLSCLKAMSIPAPAVNPITTEWDTKLTNLPIRNKPMIN
jgi:hypothetical protein